MACALYRMIVKAQQDGNHQSITHHIIKKTYLTSNRNRKQAVLLHNLHGFSQTLPPIAARTTETCPLCFTTTSYIMAPAHQFSFIYAALNPFAVIRHLMFGCKKTHGSADLPLYHHHRVHNEVNFISIPNCHKLSLRNNKRPQTTCFVRGISVQHSSILGHRPSCRSTPRQKWDGIS